MAFDIAIFDREKTPRMTHIYDIMERWIPRNLLEKVEFVSKDKAKKRIATKLLENSVIPKTEDAKKYLNLEMLV